MTTAASLPSTAAEYTAALAAHGGDTILSRGGRTGAKVHLATPGSSSTACGHWTKFQMSNFKLSPERAEQLTACSKCFH
jgi:hypothetical protein